MLSESEKRLILDNRKLGATELTRQIIRIRMKMKMKIVKQNTLKDAVSKYLDDNTVREETPIPQLPELPLMKQRLPPRGQNDATSDECKEVLEHLLDSLGDDSLQPFWADILVDYYRK